jgi:hypothetical protein
MPKREGERERARERHGERASERRRQREREREREMHRERERERDGETPKDHRHPKTKKREIAAGRRAVDNTDIARASSPGQPLPTNLACHLPHPLPPASEALPHAVLLLSLALLLSLSLPPSLLLLIC